MQHLTPAEYYQTLPKKVLAAGVIFTDNQERVLILQTTYKDSGWEVPGGIVEADETPLEAALREVREEIGVELEPSQIQLATIDARRPTPERPSSIQFHFWGGVIKPESITVDKKEISGFQFVPISELDQYLVERLARRTKETVVAAQAGRIVYLEDGYPVVKTEP